MFRSLRRIVRRLDPDRATVYAENHLHRGQRWHTLTQTDVLGVNYELDRLADAHRLSRTGSLVISEVGNCAYTARGDSEAELRQMARWEQDLDRIDAHPYVAGYALWCHADYASERKGRRRRHAGLVDAWRLPKLSAAYMQARTDPELFVSVHGDWSRHGPAGPRTLHVFSNGDHIRLGTAARVLAEQRLTRTDGGPARFRASFALPFAAAPLQVTAYRQTQSRTIQLLPWDRAHALTLAPDRTRGDAAARDTIGFNLRVVDACGVTVPDYEGEAQIQIEGPARGRFFTPRHIVDLHAGTGRGFVTGIGPAGAVALSGQTEGLRPATGQLHFE